MTGSGPPSPGRVRSGLGRPTTSRPILARGPDVSTPPPDPTLTKPSAGPDPAPLTGAPDPVGPVLAGRYHLVRSLGEGGMGSVWLARDAELDRDVAVKLLPVERVSSADTVKRFRREAQALARLSHPNIVQAFDVGEHDGRPFFVMEHVAGSNLADRLTAGGPLPPTRAADVGHQVALALAYAHAAGLVHRDVKPGNLILAADGRVKLLDLGLARFLQDHLADGTRTREGAGMGTPDYSAPEQFRDARTADARADVYALGCTLYHLIGGRAPFPGSSLGAKLTAHEFADPTPLEELAPDMPLGLALAVRRMMAKRPADRFQTAPDAADALAPYVAGGASTIGDFRKTAAWDGSQIRSRTVRRRGRWATAAAGLAAGLLIAVLAAAAGQRAGWVRFGDTTEVAQGAPPEPPKQVEPTPPQPDPPKAVTPDDPNVLTVSQRPEGGGKYRTIDGALKDVKPRQTVRVLDDGTYSERILLNVPARHTGVTLEAVRRATLTPPPDSLALVITNAPGVTVRGFHVSGPSTYLCGAGGAVAGLVIDDIDFSGSGPVTCGITIESAALTDGEPPIRIRNCRFKGIARGIRVSGVDNDLRSAIPSARILISDNRFDEVALFGLTLIGEVRHVHVVGNRFSQCGSVGILIESLLPKADDILVANNTLSDCVSGIRLTPRTPAVNGTRVRVKGNLIRGRGLEDVWFADNGGVLAGVRGDLDGKLLAGAWSFSHNWRESTAGRAGVGRVPPSPTDVARDRIDGLDTDTKSPTFLRPAKGSPLATDGAGKDDPTLPRYVGALPPEGEYPWDWDRTWRMPADAQLLTVSKDEKDGGAYRTITDALNDARPWATVRVLDDADYSEALVISHPDRLTGLTLEAPRGAVLRGPTSLVVFVVSNVPDVVFRGFRVRLEGKTRYGVLMHGAAGGGVIERVAFEGRPSGTFTAGVGVEHLSPTGRATTVRGCRFTGLGVGLRVSGLDDDGRRPLPCRGVRVVDNDIDRSQFGVLVTGAVDDLHVVGNRVRDATMGGVQVNTLLGRPRNLLIANNTFHRAPKALSVYGNGADLPRVASFQFRNNLLLKAGGPDTMFMDMGDDPRGVGKCGDGEALSRLLPTGHNWREATPQDAWRAAGWIPPSPADVLKDSLDGIDRDPESPTFLRPAKDSPLAAGGAGTGDPTLPVYVGALPPAGAEPWDWERTWRWRTAGPKPSDTPKPPEKKP